VRIDGAHIIWQISAMTDMTFAFFPVVSEGLVSGLDKDKWTLGYINRVAGDEYYHKFRRFDKEKQDTDEITSSRKSGEKPAADDYTQVRHIELDRCLSMKVSDYIAYLRQRGAALEDEDASDFTFRDHLGTDHTIDVIDSVLYMIDYDMVKYLPALYADFVAGFKLPGTLPGGSHCMMNSVSPNGRPFMGPNVYITPPASFTHFHQDGHGTVDSGHFCLSGYNEVVMVRRLPERHKRNALRLLTGAYRKKSERTFEALYNLPHTDGLGEKPQWPDNEAIENCNKLK
jgi:hypothetical protein